MIYFYTIICLLLFMAWSYLFIKTYQLSGYQPNIFLKEILSLNLAYGDKSKFSLTKRMIRYLITLAVVAFLFFFLVNFFIYNIWLKLFDILIIFLFAPIIMMFVHYLLYPIEKLIKLYYIQKTKKKLEKKKIIKIAITGSYGKTSTKNILTAMLEKEYKVCVTPKNYNTEMGITKTILNDLDDHDIFIAEMGARHKGDIESLTDIVKSDYGIITTIGAQHIETFKTLENIEDTKFELTKGLTKNGIMVFNGDSSSTLKLFSKYQGEKYLTCTRDGFAFAENVICSPNGSLFTLNLNGEKLEVQTKLLGKCNIDNIVTASALAKIIGIKNEDIVSAIKKLEPTAHRLELLKNNYCTIIDDSYNCNIVGAQEALDVLNSFKGVKIVVTPGIVEMGEMQSDVNFKLGGMIAEVADYIIIMNDVNKNELLSGAIAHNFDREKIHFAQSRKKQKELLEVLTCKDCVVLFENDLPDNYS